VRSMTALLTMSAIACVVGFMHLSGVRPSVRLSVCPVIRPPHAAAAGLLLRARRSRDIDRLLRGAEQRRRHITALGSNCMQAVSH